MDMWINLGFFKFVTCLVNVLSEKIYLFIDLSIRLFFFFFLFKR